MLLRILLLLTTLLYLIGCSSGSQDMTDLVQYVKTQKETIPPQKVEDLPWLRFQQPTTVDAKKLNNPFIDIAIAKAKSQKNLVNNRDALKPDLKRKKTPLEAFELSDFDFLGVISQGQELWAIISNTATDDTTSIVKVGDYLGKHYGKIIKITPNQIDLDQRIQNSNGKWVKKIATLKLQASENG